MGAALLGALLTVVGVLLFYLSNPARVVTLQRFTGQQLEVVSGRAQVTAHGLHIEQAGADGAALLRTKLAVPAILLRRVSWDISGLGEDSALYLVWVATVDGVSANHQQLLPTHGSGSFDLSASDGWQGRIDMLGLAIVATFTAPIVVHEVALIPKALSSSTLLHLAFDEWRSYSDWSQRSINFSAGASTQMLFPPVLLVALWIACSAIIYAAAGATCRAGTWLPYVALFLLGWLVLDARWQWELRQRLAHSQQRFAGKDMQERRLADLDGNLYQFSRSVRQHLPSSPVRLFIVSNDPAGFAAGRIRYHLLPHNGYMGFFHPPPAAPDDYLLLLQPLPQVQYQPAQRLLVWEGGELPVQELYTNPNGALFRVR